MSFNSDSKENLSTRMSFQLRTIMTRELIIGSDTWSTFPGIRPVVFSLQPNVIKISELCKSIFATLLSPIKTVTSPEWSFPVIAISDVTIHFNG